jgi:nucleosome binding factor SPN SPT16 subunit
MISLGTKYSMYCANIARTYMVDPNTTQEADYKLLLEAQEAAIAALVEDAPMSAAPRAAIDYLEVWTPVTPSVCMCVGMCARGPACVGMCEREKAFTCTDTRACMRARACVCVWRGCMWESMTV